MQCLGLTVLLGAHKIDFISFKVRRKKEFLVEENGLISDINIFVFIIQAVITCNF